MTRTTNESSALVLLCGNAVLCEAVCAFARRVHPGGRVDLLALDKQRGFAERLCSEHNLNQIHTLDERLYGMFRNEASRRKVLGMMSDPYAVCYFPFNDFKSNGFVLGSLVAGKVTAVNPARTNDGLPFTLSGPDPDESIRPLASGNGWRQDADAALAEIRRRLETGGAAWDDLPSEKSGEKPWTGLLNGFPYDIGVAARYYQASLLLKDASVLDVGCGTGFGSFLLSRMCESVLAVDYDTDAVRIARRLWTDPGRNLRFETADAQSSLPRGPFDAVTLFEVIEHVREPQDLLDRIFQHTAPGGVLIGSTPDPELFPFRSARTAENRDDRFLWKWHLDEFDPDAMSTLLKKTGFADIRIKRLFYQRAQQLESALARSAGDKERMLDLLDESMDVKASDFVFTEDAPPGHCDYSYVFIAQKPRT